jgi:hypothetical protein
VHFLELHAFLVLVSLPKQTALAHADGEQLVVASLDVLEFCENNDVFIIWGTIGPHTLTFSPVFWHLGRNIDDDLRILIYFLQKLLPGGPDLVILGAEDREAVSYRNVLYLLGLKKLVLITDLGEGRHCVALLDAAAVTEDLGMAAYSTVPEEFLVVQVFLEAPTPALGQRRVAGDVSSVLLQFVALFALGNLFSLLGKMELLIRALIVHRVILEHNPAGICTSSYEPDLFVLEISTLGELLEPLAAKLTSLIQVSFLSENGSVVGGIDHFLRHKATLHDDWIFESVLLFLHDTRDALLKLALFAAVGGARDFGLALAFAGVVARDGVVDQRATGWTCHLWLSSHERSGIHVAKASKTRACDRVVEVAVIRGPGNL